MHNVVLEVTSDKAVVFAPIEQSQACIHCMKCLFTYAQCHMTLMNRSHRSHTLSSPKAPTMTSGHSGSAPASFRTGSCRGDLPPQPRPGPVYAHFDKGEGGLARPPPPDVCPLRRSGIPGPALRHMRIREMLLDQHIVELFLNHIAP